MMEKEHRFLVARVIIGELLLFLALVWSAFVWITLTDVTLYPDLYPLTDARKLAWIRNTFLFLVFFLGGSKLGFGKLEPFHGRIFAHQLHQHIQVKYQSSLWSWVTKLVGLLLLLFGGFELLSDVLTLANNNIYDIIITAAVTTLPPIIFGYRWYESGEYISRLVKRDTTSNRPLDTRLIKEHEIGLDQYRNEEFIVVRPSPLKWLIALFFASLLNFGMILFFNSNSLLWGEIILVILLSILSWKFLSPWIYWNLLFRPIHSWTMNKRKGDAGKSLGNWIMSLIFGIDFSSDKTYFIEQYPDSVNLNELYSVFKQRAIPLFGSIVPIAFILVSILYPPSRFVGHGTDILIHVFDMLLLGTFFSFWLMPVTWITKDTGIKTLNSQRSIKAVASNLEKSQLQNLIGIAGFITAIGYILAIYQQLPELSTYGGNWENPGLAVIDAIFFLVFLLSTCLGAIYLGTILYFRFFHQRIVNEFRKRISILLPLGTPLARELNQKEMEIFEKIH